MKGYWRKSPIVKTLLILVLVIVPLAFAVGRTLVQAAPFQQGHQTVKTLLSSVTPTAQPHLLAGNDWPTYLYDSQRSSAANDPNLSLHTIAQLTLHWSFQTQGTIAAQPIVVGNTVYVGSWDGYEYALDALTGKLRWRTYLGVTHPGTNCYPSFAGITSSATVQNGVVYVGGGADYWYALNAQTGAVLWKVYTGDSSVQGGHFNWSSPLIYNGSAYIGIASEGDCPLVQGRLLRVDLRTHQVVATFDTVPNGQIGGGIWASPGVDTTTNTIYVVDGNETSDVQTYVRSILALDATTLQLKDHWQVPLTANITDGDFSTTPLLFDDTHGIPMLAAYNKNGHLYVFKRNDLLAGPLWSDLLAEPSDCPECEQTSVSTPTYGNGTLFFASGNNAVNGVNYRGVVQALDPDTGKILWRRGTSGPIFAALTYDNGMLFDNAGGVIEVRNAITGEVLYTFQTSAGLIYSPTSIARGQFFAGDTNGMLYALGLPYAPPAPPFLDSHCASGWSCQDIGNPAVASIDHYGGGVWQIQATSTGIGNTADQFHFVEQPATGNVQISTRISSQAEQAGLMLRQRSDPGSPYYGVFLSNTGQLSVQYRSAFNGPTTSVRTTLAHPPSSLYLAIQRHDDRFEAAYSLDGHTYTLIAGGTVVVVMPDSLLSGMVVSASTGGSATYSDVAMGAPTLQFTPVPLTTPCPANWHCADIGNPQVQGGQWFNGSAWKLQGAGTDIWNDWDQFHFVWQILPGNGAISARVTTETMANPWGKAGVMLRQGNAANTLYYAAYVTPEQSGNGILVEARQQNRLLAVTYASISGTVPIYLKVARVGQAFSAYTSHDGITWTLIPGSTYNEDMQGPLLAGLALTSHAPSVLATATFDHIIVGA